MKPRISLERKLDNKSRIVHRKLEITYHPELGSATKFPACGQVDTPDIPHAVLPRYRLVAILSNEALQYTLGIAL
jgi:hypothetical protein